MRIVSEKKLKDCWQEHAEAQGALEAWRDFVKRAEWTSPADVQADFGADSVLPDSRACFNIKGKKYRVVVHIHYKSQIVFIRFLGTHDEYNRIDALTI
jgi:mRNA interferase HigB